MRIVMAQMPPKPFGLGITNCRPARDVIAGIEEAERLGAEIAFCAEDVNCRDAFALLTLAAARTTRIRLATGVVNPYTRNPTSLAMAIATLDEVSGGRAALGLGSSSPSLIEGQMGIPVGASLTVLRESTEVLRQLLGGETVSYEGKRFRYRSASLEVQTVQPRIPLFFAAMGPATLHLAGQVADGVLLNVGASTDYIRWAVEQVRVGARAAGRDPCDITIAAWLTAYVSVDLEQSMVRAREWLAVMLSIPRQGELLIEHGGGNPAILSEIRERYHAYPHRGDRAAAARFVPEEMASRMALIGDTKEVRRRVDEYVHAGVQLPVLSLSAVRALYGGGSGAPL